MAMPLIDDRLLDHVIYPESDDEPMSECALQGLAIRTLVLGFERLYSGRDDVFVGADQFWYPVKGEPKIVARARHDGGGRAAGEADVARSAATGGGSTAGTWRWPSKCSRPATPGQRWCASASSTTGMVSTSTGCSTRQRKRWRCGCAKRMPSAACGARDRPGQPHQWRVAEGRRRRVGRARPRGRPPLVEPPRRRGESEPSTEAKRAEHEAASRARSGEPTPPSGG